MTHRIAFFIYGSIFVDQAGQRAASGIALPIWYIRYIYLFIYLKKELKVQKKGHTFHPHDQPLYIFLIRIQHIVYQNII